MRYDPAKITIIPFYKVYTPTDIVNKADFIALHSNNATALVFPSGLSSSSRLLRLPLLQRNLLPFDADIVVEVTVGLDSGIRSGDSDPKFFISDGSDGIGFEMREEADRCRGMEAIMGSAYTSLVNVLPGASHDSTILPEQFVLTIKPSQKWGSCYNSVDSGVISPVSYTRTINLDQGLWLEVYREGSHEQYVFNYIKVEIHENC